jgi:hypothetical protein
MEGGGEGGGGGGEGGGGRREEGEERREKGEGRRDCTQSFFSFFHTTSSEINQITLIGQLLNQFIANTLICYANILEKTLERNLIPPVTRITLGVEDMSIVAVAVVVGVVVVVVVVGVAGVAHVFFYSI